MDIIIPMYEAQYVELHAQSLALLREVPRERLYWRPEHFEDATQVYSVGEYMLKSAGAVEQTFGGLTANLWDDPFEWTLPETIDTKRKFESYLGEVEATRQRGFALFSGDDVLQKEVAMPSGEMQTISSLLLDTLLRAKRYKGQAIATFRLFSDAHIPGN